MAMSEQVMAQERPSLVIMTRWDGEQVVAQEQEIIPEVEVKHRTPKKLPKALRSGEAEKFLATFNTKCISGLRDRCMFELMYKCGLRISETCKLKMSNVDLKEGYLYLQKAKGNKDRTVPMDEEVIQWLEKWLVKKPIESDYFFCTFKGGMLDQRQLRSKCKLIAQKAEIYIQDGDEKKLAWPHTFRHTCFTECLEEGLTIKEIQELAGHASLATTSVYLSVRPEKLREKMRNRKK